MSKILKFGDLKRNLLLCFCLSAAILFLIMGCNVNKNVEREPKNPIATEDVKVVTLTPQALKSKEDFTKITESAFAPDIPPQQLVKQAKGMVANLTMLDISDENKKDLNEILEYLDTIKKPSEYFNDINNIIDFMQAMTRSNAILTEIEPDNFKVNYKAAQQYTNLGYMIEGLSQSKKHKQLSEQYKRKGVQASKDLVERFPDEAKGYAQLAFSVIIADGDKKKAMELFKRCLELDPKSEFCREKYDDLFEELDIGKNSKAK